MPCGIAAGFSGIAVQHGHRNVMDVGGFDMIYLDPRSSVQADNEDSGKADVARVGKVKMRRK
jgi:hypothetical protein